MVYFSFEHDCYAIQKEYSFHLKKKDSWQIVVTNTFYFQLVRDDSFSFKTFNWNSFVLSGPVMKKQGAYRLQRAFCLLFMQEHFELLKGYDCLITQI